MKFHREDTAIVFIDPQNDVLSEKGLAWPSRARKPSRKQYH
jgi:hypothetical protein